MKLYQLFLLAILFVGAAVAQAQTLPAPIDLDGFAWSSNIGWISLNCRNDSNCASSDYKVTINADRTITGWGWSSNLGWVKFGGLASFPVGGGTAAENARLTGTYPNLTWSGWARACAGTLGGTCSTMSNNPEAGAWDGWIALRGTNHAITSNMATGMNADSYAWGSEVVGWIDMFSQVTFATTSATIWGNNCTITQGASTCATQLNWDIDTSAVSPNMYRVTAPASQLSTNRTQTNYGVTIGLGNTTFHARSGTTMLDAVTLNASCAAGLSPSGGICVLGTGTTSPTMNLKAVPPIVRRGNTATINWSLSSLAGNTCVINGPGITNSAVGTVTGSVQTGPILNTATVRMTCTGAYGSVEERTTIEVIPVAAEV